MTMQKDIARIVSHYDPRQPARIDHLSVVVEGMLTIHRSDTIKRPYTPEEVMELVDEFAFANWDQPLGWVRRDGFFMPAAYIRHDKLLHYLGMHVVDAEDRGWARIGQTSWQCLYRLTPAQKRALTARDYPIDKDEERMKKPWHGLPPYPDTVHQSRRIPR